MRNSIWKFPVFSMLPLLIAFISCKKDSGNTTPDVGPTVTIGSQIWTLKNLNVTTYRNGDSIPQVTNSTFWAGLNSGAWCYYDNDSANGSVYGKLYNWYAINDSRGLAPLGWHIPTINEWTTLSSFLGGESVAGGKMKSITWWEPPNTGATDESGFTGLPGGLRTSLGNFNKIRNDGYWWSSSINNFTLKGWFIYLHHDAGLTGTYNDDRRLGFSVRCLKD